MDTNSDVADRLYAAAAKISDEYKVEAGNRSKCFSQEELFEHSGLDNQKALLPIIQYLSNQNLFRTVKIRDKLNWTVRPRDAAKQIAALDQDERRIYEIVEEAHDNGIWMRELKKKTTIPPLSVQKAIGKMEKSRLIKSIKSVKNPAQRTYMLSHLLPSEDVTGNSFFDAGDLDESFRDELMNLIVFWVRQQSWAEPKKRSHKRDATSPDDERTGRKRRLNSDIEDAPLGVKRRPHRLEGEIEYTQLAYRVGSHHYPTSEDIHGFLINTEAIKPTKRASLTVAEIQGCTDVLVWDGKLEKVRNHDSISWGYRTVRGVHFRSPNMEESGDMGEGTALTQAPCGRCPVIEMCCEGGPVNPQGCTYFEQWLKA